MRDQSAVLRRIRTLLLGILLLGTAGTLTELLLIAHDEDATQLIPIVLAAVGIPVTVWNLIRPGTASVRTLQLLMILYVAAGLAGMFFHYSANVEFQLEMEPALAGSALLWKVLQAKSPPALSPGLMIQMGLLGFVYAWKHPSLESGWKEINDDA